MTNAERIARAERAKAALDEFLAPAMEHVMTDYNRRIIEIAAETPWKTEPISKLAQAFKIVRTVEAHLQALVMDGELARQDMSYAAQIERIPVEKRKVLGLL